MPKSNKPVPPARAGSHPRAKPAKRNVSMRKRDKHKKSDMDSSQTTISEEPEMPLVDEETLKREREEARQKWLAEQRKKYPVAPDGYIPNSVVRRTLRVHRPSNETSQTTQVDQKTSDITTDMLFRPKLPSDSEVKVTAVKSASFVSSSAASEKRQKSASAHTKRLQRPFDEFNDVITQVRQESDVEDHQEEVNLEHDDVDSAFQASSVQIADENTTNGELSTNDVTSEDQSDPQRKGRVEDEDAMAIQNALDCLLLGDSRSTILQDVESNEHIYDEYDDTNSIKGQSLVATSSIIELSINIATSIDDIIDPNTNLDDVNASAEQITEELLDIGSETEVNRDTEEYLQQELIKTGQDDVILADNDEADLLIDEALLKSLPPSRLNSAENQPNNVGPPSNDVTSVIDIELPKSLPPSPFSSVLYQPDETMDSVDIIGMSHVTSRVDDSMANDDDGQLELISSSDQQIGDSTQHISVLFHSINDLKDEDTMMSRGRKSQSQTHPVTASQHSMSNGNTDIDTTLEQDMKLYVEDDHVDSLALVDSVLDDNVDIDVTDGPISKVDFDQSAVGLLPSQTGPGSLASTNRELTSPDIDSISSLRSRSAVGVGRRVHSSGAARSNDVPHSADHTISVRFLDSPLRPSTFTSRSDHNLSSSQRSSVHQVEPLGLTTVDVYRNVLSPLKRSSKSEITSVKQSSGASHSHSPGGSRFLPCIHNSPTCHSCQYSELVKKRMHDHISVGRHLRSIRNAGLLCDFSRPLGYSAVKGMTSSFI